MFSKKSLLLCFVLCVVVLFATHPTLAHSLAPDTGGIDITGDEDAIGNIFWNVVRFLRKIVFIVSIGGIVLTPILGVFKKDWGAVFGWSCAGLMVAFLISTAIAIFSPA